jgi:signal transduction histidine kinase
VYGIAVAVTAICLLFIVPLLSSGVADPVSDLIRATRAVAEGRLDTRVPVTTTDELGELAHSFNQMLEEIRATRVRIVAASDAARRAVERDLHDGAQQRLVLLKLKLNMLEREPDRTELIAEIRNELDHALDELRDLARGIYPPLLENEGLTGALRDVADRATMPVELSCNGTGRYPAEIEAAVYFCCLEALQNTAKHAGDHAHALIHLSERDHTLEFEVRDDGVGFQATNGGLSSGLQNMRDRLGALGGLLNVSSAPGAGTTIKGSVPL